jgi:hypothetical protein
VSFEQIASHDAWVIIKPFGYQGFHHKSELSFFLSIQSIMIFLKIDFQKRPQGPSKGPCVGSFKAPPWWPLKVPFRGSKAPLKGPKSLKKNP